MIDQSSPAAPRVTVVLPAYNAAAHLGEAIDSILAQSFRDFELLIINDGSTDDTAAIARGYDDPRIVFANHTENRGLIDVLNEGIEKARGTYLARMDADDIARPQRLEAQVAFLDANPDIGILGTAFQAFGPQAGDKVSAYALDDGEIRWKMLHECHLCHPSVMIRRDVLITHQLRYDKQFPHAEDYALWHEAGKFTRFANLPEVLLDYRWHDDNVSVKHAETQQMHSARVRKLFFLDVGLDVSNEDLELWRELAYQRYPHEIKGLNQVQLLLERFAAQASKQGVWPAKELLERLGHLWFHACYALRRHGGYKVFRSSALAKHGSSAVARLKFSLRRFV